MARKNRSGIDWNDPEQCKTRLRENARRLKQQGKRDHTVTIDGVEYPSQAEAARQLGVTPQAIWMRIHSAWRRAHRNKYQRRKTDPRPERKRWVRMSKDDAELAVRLLPLFPQHSTIDALYSYALRKLAETTDD